MNNKSKDYISAALFAAVISISAQVVIPLPSGLPLTLQTLAVCLCGYLLKPKYSLMSVSTYLLLGLFGAPVFSYFGGGPAVLFGKNGGFLLGFIFIALLCSISRHKNRIVKIILGFTGILFCHIIGVIQFSLVFGMPIISAFLIVSLPTLLKDMVCVFISIFISEKLKFN